MRMVKFDSGNNMIHIRKEKKRTEKETGESKSKQHKGRRDPSSLSDAAHGFCIVHGGISNLSEHRYARHRHPQGVLLPFKYESCWHVLTPHKCHVTSVKKQG